MPTAMGDQLGGVIASARATVTPERERELAERQRQADERQAAARQEKLAAILGRRYGPGRVRLDTMRVYHPAIGEAVKTLRAFEADIADAIKQGRNLVIYGSVGTGKDHMLAAMLYAAAGVGASCHWTNGLEIYGAFRDRMDQAKTEAGLLDTLGKPDVLGISDPTPPFGSASDWNIATLYRVIDSRYRACRGTWVTLNAASKDDAEQQLSDRVFDRLIDGAVIVPCFWPSYRERQLRAS